MAPPVRHRIVQSGEHKSLNEVPDNAEKLQPLFWMWQYEDKILCDSSCRSFKFCCDMRGLCPESSAVRSAAWRLLAEPSFAESAWAVTSHRRQHSARLAVLNKKGSQSCSRNLVSLLLCLSPTGSMLGFSPRNFLHAVHA